MSPAPLVTVLIPALNEEADIAGCIDAVGAQTWPLDRVEVLLVDGCSTDATVAMAEATAARHEFGALKVLSNPQQRTSISLNSGLEQAAGEVIVRVDARSRIEPHHVAACVDILRARPDVGVVGGAQVAEARGPGAADVGIARALNNRWSTGLARYRRWRVSGPADTVWMGAFRSGELRELGGWDPGVALNEDHDLNRRYREAGLMVWFEASLRPRYLPRRSFGAVVRQHLRYGMVKGTWWRRGVRPEPRQLVLLAMPPVALVVGAASLRRWPLTTLVAGAATLLAVEGSGTSGPPGGVAARSAAVATTVAMDASWWAGVIAGAFGRPRGTDLHNG